MVADLLVVWLELRQHTRHQLTTSSSKHNLLRRYHYSQNQGIDIVPSKQAASSAVHISPVFLLSTASHMISLFVKHGKSTGITADTRAAVNVI